jgi:hypothetical protein
MSGPLSRSKILAGIPRPVLNLKNLAGKLAQGHCEGANAWGGCRDTLEMTRSPFTMICLSEFEKSIKLCYAIRVARFFLVHDTKTGKK